VPHITVTANRSSDRGNGSVMLRERVSVADFESDHFAAQLVERLGWAVSDADEVESKEPAGPSVDAPAGPSADEPAGPSVDAPGSEPEGDGVVEPDLVRERQPA
jgi:hypothetical protein